MVGGTRFMLYSLPVGLSTIIQQPSNVHLGTELKTP